MSRSGYSDDCDDQWAMIRWRGAVSSAIRGKRGQAFLRELAAALDAMPEKRLVENAFEADGEFCTLGVIAAARGTDVSNIDAEYNCSEEIAGALGIPRAVAAEIMWENDESVSNERGEHVEICGPMRTGHPHWEKHIRWVYIPNEGAAEKRWRYMRNWIAEHISQEHERQSQKT